MSKKPDAIEAGAESSGKRKYILMAGGVLVVLVVGGFFGFKKMHQTPQAVAPKKVELTIIPIPTIISNLDAGDGRARFVRVTARVQAEGTLSPDKLALVMPQIQDAFQTCLHGMRPDEMAGSGVYRLRETMLVQIANIMAPLPVRDLFFVEVLVQ